MLYNVDVMTLTRIILLLSFSAYAGHFDFLDHHIAQKFTHFDPDFLNGSQVLLRFKNVWEQTKNAPSELKDTTAHSFLEELKKEEGLFHTLEDNLIPYLEKKDIEGFLKDEGSRIFRESFTLEGILPEIDKRMAVCAQKHGFGDAWFLNDATFDQHVRQILRDEIQHDYTRLGLEAFIKIMFCTCMCFDADRAAEKEGPRVSTLQNRMEQVVIMKSPETFAKFLKHEVNPETNTSESYINDVIMELNVLGALHNHDLSKLRFLFTKDGAFTIPSWFAAISHFEGHLITLPHIFENLHKLSVHEAYFGLDECVYHDIHHTSFVSTQAAFINTQYTAINPQESAHQALNHAILKHSQHIWDSQGRNRLHWYMLTMFRAMHDEITRPRPYGAHKLDGLKRVICSIRKTGDIGFRHALSLLLGREALPEETDHIFYKLEQLVFNALFQTLPAFLCEKPLHNEIVEASKIYRFQEATSEEELLIILNTLIMEIISCDSSDEITAFTELAIWCYNSIQIRPKQLALFRDLLNNRESGGGERFSAFPNIIEELIGHNKKLQGHRHSTQEFIGKLLENITPSGRPLQAFSGVTSVVTDYSTLLVHYDTTSNVILLLLPRDYSVFKDAKLHHIAGLSVFLETIVRRCDMSHLCDRLWKTHVDSIALNARLPSSSLQYDIEPRLPISV